ncbi:unnamed protein product [Gordionus sp. m RMFG-2023]|uniref:glia maturation factor beta-like n=1 Tax=Gordionus sp. m RMFG-2023 TaxID=3053472 RepID=UPI0030DF0B1D
MISSFNKNSEDCTLDKALNEKINKLCSETKPQISALILKIDKNKKLIILDQELINCSIDDIKDTLSETLPRYIIMSYILDYPDGRKGFPVFLLFVSPSGIKMELSVQYSYNLKTVSALGKFTRVITLCNIDDFSKEWLDKELFRSKT